VKKFSSLQNIEKLPLQEEKVFNMDNVVSSSQVTIKSSSTPSFQESLSCERLEFIKNKKK